MAPSVPVEGHLQRNEYLAPSMNEALRHDADHGIRLAIKPERSADDGRVPTEARVPERVAENRDLRPALLILGVGVPAAQHRPDAEYVAKRSGRRERADTFGFAVARKHEPLAARTADRREELIARLPVVE